MTDKRCQLRQELIGKNVESTKQVSYQHYDILLRNKFLFLLSTLNLLLGSSHQKLHQFGSHPVL